MYFTGRLLGQIITIITFPGVVIHELSHQLFCRYLNVEVQEVCYFRIGNPAGYVIHKPTEKWIHTVAIAAGPFFINSLIAAILAFPVASRIELGSNISDALLLWLAISIGMHAIPSTGDAQSMWKAVSGNRASLIAKLFVAPIVAIIYLLSLGSILWLDLFYGIFVCFILPQLLIQAIA